MVGRRGQVSSRTCTDVPARLCCFTAEKPCALLGVLSHRCSPQAHISRSISTLRNCFHKSNSSKNKNSTTTTTKIAGIFALDQRLSHFDGSESSAKFIKEQVLRLHPKRAQSESMGLGPSICSFHKLPTGFQCPTTREEHWPRSMQSCGDTTNVKCRPKLKIHSNETLGYWFFLMTTIIKEKWKYRFYTCTSEHQIYAQCSWFSSLFRFDPHRVCALYNVIKWEAEAMLANKSELSSPIWTEVWW